MNSIIKTDSIESQDYNYLLRLLSSVICGKTAPRPNDNINWAAVFSAASKHSVAGMTYYAVKTLPEDCRPNKDVYADFVSSYRAELVLESNIQFETEKLLQEFDSAGIDVLPLKGFVIKEYYPVASMRTMSDVDILYREKDKEKVEEIFSRYGYTLKYDGFEQLAFEKEPVHYYELHSALMFRHKLDNDYFSDIWDRVVFAEDSHIASLRPEDFYIYLLEHLVKHVEGGGAGLRMVMDIFIYRQAHAKELDSEYIRSELEKLNLQQFADKIQSLTHSWFETNTPDTDSVCARFILSCPTFGFVSNAIVFNSLMHEHKEGKKQRGITRLLRRMIPSAAYINRRFPITKKHKILYPFFIPLYWLVRMFKDKNVNYSSVKLYLNPDKVSNVGDINKVIEEFGFDRRM